MTPHDSSSHDEEPNISQKYHNHWSNEGPDELSFWIHETAVETIIGSYFWLKDKISKLTQCGSHSLVVLVGQTPGVWPGHQGRVEGYHN